MDFVRVSTNEGIAEARLKRGKVNALNEQAVEEIADCFQRLAADPDIRAVIFTGDGSFFSFGFDIPEFLSYSRESFSRFLTRFTSLYSLSVHLSKTSRGCIEWPCNRRRMHACTGLRLQDHGFGKGKNFLERDHLWLIGICGQCGDAQVPGWGQERPGGSLRRNDVLGGDGVATGNDRSRFRLTENLVKDAQELARRLAAKDAAAFRSMKGLLRACGGRNGEEGREVCAGVC